MSDFHVGLLGSGSVALFLAGHFYAAGARVTLFVQTASIDKVERQPIEVSGAFGDHVIPVGGIDIADAAKPTQPLDMLIVTTKAFDVEEALKPFAGLATLPPVLLMQNGLGSADIARRILGPTASIFSTTMMIGMARQTPTQARVLGCAGPIRCGALLGGDSAPLERMLAVAEKGFVPFAQDLEIQDTVLFKLLFNTCMNPTGALTGQTYGGLLEDPNSRDLIIGLAKETLAVFDKVYDYRPAQSAQDYVENHLWPIVFPNATAHQSSMLQDMQANRRTEIDFLNGAVVRLALEHGLEAPRHQTIVNLVKAREAFGLRLTSKARD